MSIKNIEEMPDVLPDYETISIAFVVKSILRVEQIENGLGGIKLFEETVEKPFIKDYDAIKNNKPSDLTAQFGLSNWGILSAFDGDKRIGGAIVAWNSPEVLMLEGRGDLACLWDLRVAPEYRGKGVGRQLFERAVDWAQARNYRLLKIETQNTNVPACRFYARQDCELGTINRFAYPELMNETQIVWYRKL